jgi:hypothetical protein
MVEDMRYQRRLLQDLRTRRLKPSAERMLWTYAIGKPVEDVDAATPRFRDGARRANARRIVGSQRKDSSTDIIAQQRICRLPQHQLP